MMHSQFDAAKAEGNARIRAKAEGQVVRIRTLTGRTGSYLHLP
jgi:hypothetical protein